MGAPRESYVKRARMSAMAGPYLLLAGIALAALGVALSPALWLLIVVMLASAPVLQIPRHAAWRKQNDALEFLSLLSMPMLLAILAIAWLSPKGLLSTGTILQGLGGFLIGLGLYHLVMKKHTLRLADEIEAQNDA